MTEAVDIVKRIRSQSRAGGDLAGLVDALISGIMCLAERVSDWNRNSHSPTGSARGTLPFGLLESH